MDFNIGFVGHVDHGKSTLIGQLLVQSGEIPEHQVEEYKKEATSRGRADSALAFISDDRLEERDRGLSINPSYSRLRTDTYNFSLIDCPGHQYYMGNMIRGISQADASVLVVAADDGIQELTTEHALIAQVMAGEEAIVAVSKMDKVDYDEDAFKSVAGEVTSLLSQLPFVDSDVPVVPVSGLEARNVTPKDEGIEWFEGPTLLEAFDSLSPPPAREDLPLRLPIDDKQTMTGIGTTVAGTIRTGTLNTGNKITFKPSGTVCAVRSVESYHEKIVQAKPRNNIGVNVTGTASVNATPGDVCGKVGDPPSVAESATLRLNVVRDPPKIKPGIRVLLHAHAMNTPCELTAVETTDADGETSGMGVLTPGESGTVEVKFPEQVALERADEFPELGTILLRDNNETLAYGDVIELDP